MENKKQQQNNFTGSRACQPSESSVRKSSSDLQVNKPWPRNSRRREQPSTTRNDAQRNSKQYPTVKTRSNVDKRPRQRGGGGGSNGSSGGNNFGNSDATGFEEDGIACALDDVSASSAGLATLVEPVVTGALTKKKFRQHIDYEQNSVYAPGSKKQNLNHLLNFHYASRDADNAFRFNVFGRNGGSGKTGATQRYGANGGASKRQRFNKEQFLQANFQFVVKSGVNLSIYASPDTLIDWHLIDQINIQTEEEPQCPICLYPPIAAKLTRCGHAYCWPCILHYLALSDKTWRKCPICYEAIHIADLKSTTIVQQRQFNLDDEITFQLMRRKKGCMMIEKYTPNNLNNTDDKYPLLSASDECKRFSKFLIAKRNDILKIIEREHNELIAGQDPNSPEYVFIQQALDLLKERREKIEEMPADEDDDDAGFKTDESEQLNYDHENMQLKQELESVSEDFENAEALHAVHDLDAEISTESGIQSIEDSSIYSTSNLIERDNTKYYYFYQSLDGQNIYLHPLNVKMLQACYGTLDRAPLIISARALQKEYHSMDEDHRRKFTCLGHLPLTCQFAVIEVDLQPPFISDEILRLFKDDIQMRKKERQRREREELRREKKINEINDRQMGKLIASTANLNLTSAQEFPTWGFEEALPSVGIDVSTNSSKPTAIPTAIPKSKRQATYSTVAVVGGSPKAEEYWPTLTSPTGNNSNMYQELSSWGRNVSTPKLVTINSTNRMANSDRSSECESIDDPLADIMPMRTDLGDVLAMAMSQKKQKSTLTSAGQAVSGKKNKKAKKLVPLFSTGINYNGK